MQEITRRRALEITAAGAGALALSPLALEAQESQPFGAEFPNLESLTTGQWWNRQAVADVEKAKGKGKAKARAKGGDRAQAPPMDVPRDQVVAFAIYTHHRGVLKLSAQLYPLKPGEVR